MARLDSSITRLNGLIFYDEQSCYLFAYWIWFYSPWLVSPRVIPGDDHQMFCLPHRHVDGRQDSSQHRERLGGHLSTFLLRLSPAISNCVPNWRPRQAWPGIRITPCAFHRTEVAMSRSCPLWQPVAMRCLHFELSERPCLASFPRNELCCPMGYCVEASSYLP